MERLHAIRSGLLLDCCKYTKPENIATINVEHGFSGSVKYQTISWRFVLYFKCYKIPNFTGNDQIVTNIVAYVPKCVIAQLNH